MPGSEWHVVEVHLQYFVLGELALQLNGVPQFLDLATDGPTVSHLGKRPGKLLGYRAAPRYILPRYGLEQGSEETTHVESMMIVEVVILF